MPLRLPSALAAALCALAALAAPAADAAWTRPQAIVSGAAASQAVGAGNRHGSEAFAWTVTGRRFVSLSGRSGLVSWVRARIRLPGGRLGRVQTISRTDAIVSGPQIGVDESGNATAVWTQAAAHVSIMAAFRPHGGHFGRPVELGRSRHFVEARPALAVGRFGDAVVAWNQGAGVQVVRRGPPACTPRRARACFASPLILPAGADQTVAIGPLGSAYVVWAALVRSADAVHTRVRMAVLRRSGRREGADHDLSASGDASQPSLAVARDGTATVAWRASPPAGGEQNELAPIMAAASSPAALLAPAQAVSVWPGELPVVRLTAQGEAVAAWDERNPTPANPDGPQVGTAVRPPGAAAFGTPATSVPPTVLNHRVSLAVDAAGSAFVVYGSGAGSLSLVRPPGGGFGAPVALPAGLAAASVLAAGAKVTVLGRSAGGRTLVSDWAP